jgi:Arc/MetJ-type ribon-helix-helix transcriptional regulator
MANHPDYATVEIPDDTPATEYTWAQRRSELYDLIGEAGHPRNLERSQAELGHRYAVDQSQISHDIQAIREYETDRSGDGADANTEFVIRRSVRGLLEDEDWREAACTQLDYYDWLFDTGKREKAPDKLDVDQTTTHELDDEDRSVALDTIRELQQRQQGETNE